MPPEHKIKVTQNILVTPGIQKISNQRAIKDENVMYEQDVSKLVEVDNQQWQKQQQNQTINGRVPPLPLQHSTSSVWQDDVKPNFVNKGKIVKKRPTFKDDPTGYLNHQTAILHSSISTIYSPNAGTNELSAGDRNVKETQQQSMSQQQQGQKVFVHQPQQPYPNQRVRDVPGNQKIMSGSNINDDSLAPMLAGQSVTHMPNGVVQVHQNCDMRQIKQQIQHQIEQRNRLIKQNQQLAMIRNNIKQQQSDSNVNASVVDNNGKSQQYVFVQSPIESPVSSSTALNRSTPEMRSASSTPDSKGPLQGTNVTTSNDILSSASPLPEYGNVTNIPFAVKRKVDHLQDHSAVKNTVTSVVAGRNITTTTNAGGMIQTNMNDSIQGGIFAPNGTILYKRPAPKQVSQTMLQNCVTTPGTNMQQLNLQTLQRDGQGQFIITPNSQVVMMPSGTSQKNGGAMITTNSNIGQFVGGNIVINNGEQQAMLQSPNSGVLIQNSNVVQQQQGFLQSPNNLIAANNNSNFVSNLQQMILNNGTNIIHSPSGQNILSSPNANIITTVPSASPKMIQSAGNTVQVIQNSSPNMNQQIITQQSNGQTVVLNTLPNGMIVQQPVEGQIVNRIVQDGSGNIIQHGNRSEMMLSPDSKRKAKKRKGLTTSQSLSPQGQTLQLSPTIQQSSPHTATQSQSSSMLHVNAISPQYQGQNFQLSPGLSGLTIVPKGQSTQTAQPQQQILVQNGQTIIQPLGLLGQQLLVPAGLVITPDSNLVQIQNLSQMGNIITPQGMVIRAQSPQQKQFLSPSTGQYIVSNNGQVSPMGQIYGGSVGLVQVPQSNTASGQNSGILQQNTIVQQHHQQNQATSQVGASTTAIINSQGQYIASGQHNTSGIMTASNMKDFLNAGHSVSTQTAQQQQLLLQSSPPDTTTHSPQSPERPSSARSGASYEGMVSLAHCVSFQTYV